MKTLKKRRRIQIIGIALACVAGVLTILNFLPDDAFALFRSPSDIAEMPPAPDEVFRIGGMVEEGSLVRDQGETVRFIVTDGVSSVPVAYTGILPDLFGEGQGMVGQGRYVEGTFEAHEILAKHDEEYMPKEVIEAMKDDGTYQDPDAGDAIN